MEAKKATYPIALMARVLGVSRQGYYQWQAQVSASRLTRSRLAAGFRPIAGRLGWPIVRGGGFLCQGARPHAHFPGGAGAGPEPLRKMSTTCGQPSLAPELINNVARAAYSKKSTSAF